MNCTVKCTVNEILPRRVTLPALIPKGTHDTHKADSIAVLALYRKDFTSFHEADGIAVLALYRNDVVVLEKDRSTAEHTHFFPAASQHSHPF